MDIVLDLSDEYFFTPYVYPESLPPENIIRQLASLTVIVVLGGYALYFLTAALNYYFVFDRRLKEHPQFLKDQMKLEIACSVRSIPLMSFMSVVVFLAEVRGYSRLFDSFDETLLGKWSIATYSISFILFTDSMIYWIHRALHHKILYKRLHKTHHKWKIPTPFASHAFNPLDGFFQSLPYHIYVFIFPMHKWTYLALFVFVNIWTVSIHDGNYRVPNSLKPIVNGSAHHMDHHIFYNYNYGQFFTLWDRLGKSYRNPSSFDGTGPVDYVINKKAEQERRAAEKEADERQTSEASEDVMRIRKPEGSPDVVRRTLVQNDGRGSPSRRTRD